MSKKSGYQVFMEEAPEPAAAFNGLIQSMSMENGLDAKTMQLIYIGIKASQCNAAAVGGKPSFRAGMSYLANTPLGVLASKEQTMKTKHGLFQSILRRGMAGFAVLLAAAIFSLAGCPATAVLAEEGVQER